MRQGHGGASPGGGGGHRAPDPPSVGNMSFKGLALCIPVTMATNPLDTNDKDWRRKHSGYKHLEDAVGIFSNRNSLQRDIIQYYEPRVAI